MISLSGKILLNILLQSPPHFNQKHWSPHQHNENRNRWAPIRGLQSSPGGLVQHWCSTAVRHPQQRQRKPYAKRPKKNLRLAEGVNFVTNFFNATVVTDEEEEEDDDDYINLFTEKSIIFILLFHYFYLWYCFKSAKGPQERVRWPHTILSS